MDWEQSPNELLAILKLLQPMDVNAKDGEEEEKAVQVQNPAPAPKTGPSRHSWSNEEHQMFLYGLRQHGRHKLEKIRQYVKTKSLAQISSHSQKYFKKLEVQFVDAKPVEDVNLQQFCTDYKNEIQVITQVVKNMPRDLIKMYSETTAMDQFTKTVLGLRYVFEECQSYIIVADFAQLLFMRRVDECSCCQQILIKLGYFK